MTFHNFVNIMRIYVPKMKGRMKVFLTTDQKSKYKILSRSACEKYSMQKHKKTSIIISIKSTWDKINPEIVINDDNNIKDILWLSFCDVEKEDDADACMSFEDGRRVAEFINKHYDTVDRIIFHCDGGISRSAGVCAAIMRVKEGTDHPIFDSRSKYPNMTCYLRTLSGFGYMI